jgi:hypothetical protein
MTSPTSSAVTFRPGTIMNLLGSAIAIAGFFLPWTIVAARDPNANGSYIYHSTNGWDKATYLFQLQNNSLTNSAPQIDSATTIATFFLLTWPLLMAGITLIVNGFSTRAQHPIFTGLTVAALTTGFAALFGESLYVLIVVLATNASAGATLAYPVGAGIPILYLGYFLLIAGTTTEVLSARTAPAPKPPEGSE